MRSLIKFSVLAFLCLFFAACAHIKVEDPAARLLTNVGTMKAIEAAPVGDRVDRAERIVALSDIALTMLSDQNVILEHVYDRVVAEINWKQLSPVDQLLYRDLLDTLAARIKENIEGKALDGDKITTAKIAVGWVRQAALNYKRIIAE
jgi:hypothetical protein